MISSVYYAKPRVQSLNATSETPRAKAATRTPELRPTAAFVLLVWLPLDALVAVEDTELALNVRLATLMSAKLHVFVNADDRWC